MSFSHSNTIVLPSKSHLAAFSCLIIAAHYSWLCQQSDPPGTTAKISPVDAQEPKLKMAANRQIVLKLNNVKSAHCATCKSRPTRTCRWKHFWKRQIKINRDGTYTNFLIYEMSSKFNLLGNSSDCEYSYTRVCVWRWVSLQLHVGSWLLIYALDVLTTWRKENQDRGYSASLSRNA